jgi:hypothetical protein
MKTTIKKQIHRKWEVVYEDEYTVSTWKYDTKKNGNNPYEVDVKYKKEYPTNGEEKTPIKRTRKIKS